jgi:ADP-heptose:LPS heptosyltransferase
MKGRTLAYYPPKLRHKLMNHNYVEQQHEIAEVHYSKPISKFYATPEETAWAMKERKKMGAGPVVMWSLAGSSVHKTWPYLDNIIASIMLHYKDATVVLVGGPDCVILEQGWEKEPRVISTSGKWHIRQSLAFMQVCDLIIGPETGVLNAAAMMPVAKVVFLSHSSHANLTRDWVNTTGLLSKSTTCPGRGNNEVPACHMLHYGWEFCKQDIMTGTAQCQADITAEEAWDAVQEKLNVKRA